MLLQIVLRVLLHRLATAAAPSGETREEGKGCGVQLFGLCGVLWFGWCGVL